MHKNTSHHMLTAYPLVPSYVSPYIFIVNKLQCDYLSGPSLVYEYVHKTRYDMRALGAARPAMQQSDTKTHVTGCCMVHVCALVKTHLPKARQDAQFQSNFDTYSL